MNKKRSLLIARYLALTALAILCAGPILIMMITSFRTQAQTFTTGLSFFFAPMLGNYRDVIFDSSFGRYLVNSLIAGIAATLLALLFGCMAAYGLARFSFAGRRTIACATLILRTVPLAMIAVPVFMVWSDWHLTDSLGGLILRYAAVNPPFIIWLFYGF
ncbi:MAG: carbohydrate ABC transporter permease, partial [Candidatus Accumulibacter sp.]|nr:carbohydrate ABC transporter permease [Accumulibacter sp.]